jgi:hypothetical protein
MKEGEAGHDYGVRKAGGNFSLGGRLLQIPLGAVARVMRRIPFFSLFS